MPEQQNVKSTVTQDDKRSQREKMQSGELYLADDPELTAASRRAEERPCGLV